MRSIQVLHHKRIARKIFSKGLFRAYRVAGRPYIPAR